MDVLGHLHPIMTLYDFKSLIELNDYFREEKTCYEFLAQQIWDQGKPVCPHCGSIEVYITKSRSSKPSKRDIPEYQCANKDCSKKFTVTVGTIFHATKIPLRTWFAAIYLINTSKKGISSIQLSVQLKVTQKTAWHLLHRIREMMKEREPSMLRGIVEMDETYVGGKSKNRHANKRIKNAQGRASIIDKVPVVGIIARKWEDSEPRVRAFAVATTDKATLHSLIEANVEPGTTVITDAYRSYLRMKKDFKHVRVKHKKNFKVDGVNHTNTIENFWSVFKRGWVGVYHFMSRKHMQRYLEEFMSRYNNRKENGVQKFQQTVGKAAKIRLSYKKLTGK